MPRDESAPKDPVAPRLAAQLADNDATSAPDIRSREERKEGGTLGGDGAAAATAEKEPSYVTSPKDKPFRFDPLAPYKGAFRRFFVVYRHTVGLILGAVVAYVNTLPPEERRGFRHGWIRLSAWFCRPFVKRDLRKLPFPQQLRRRLEILGPTFIKLGQIMAIREDLLPPAVTDELANLLDKLPEVPFDQVEAILERELGGPIGRHFHKIDPKPLGSASIAQAHLAETADGERVVFKVIKPGIRSVIKSDLTLLDFFAHLLQWAMPQFQPRQIIGEFIAYTEKEVDYTFEADNAEMFAANFADLPDVRFPKIYRALSTRNVLTMEFMDGLRPGSPESLALPADQRARVVDLGAASIIRMLYRDGFFHADLHAGNLKIFPADPEKGRRVQVGFIDLGMVGRFGEQLRQRMLYYFHALVNGDVEGASRYLIEMARVGPGGDPAAFRRAVNDLARRFVVQGQRGDFSVAHLILESLSLGGKYKIFFPVEMTLMVKALVTFEGVGKTMDPHMSVAEVSERHVKKIFNAKFDPRQLTKSFLRNSPELLDLLVRAPQLLATGVNVAEQHLNAQRENPLKGLRSSIFAGACVVAGVLAVVQAGPLWLSIPLILLGLGLFLFAD